MSARVYVRKFDHDECRRLFATGAHTKTDLARRYGVSWAAIDFVVSPARRAAGIEASKRFQAKGRCDDCGGPMNNMSRSQGSTRCRICSAIALSTSARPGELQCVRCKEWKPDAGFPRNRTEKHGRRGRHTTCRACATIARQEYRERKKVPCVGCGKPALPANEKTSGGIDEPRCRECMWEWQRLPEQREAARQRAIEARQKVPA